MNYPMAHKIKRPYAYTRSEATNIRERFDRIREEHKRVVVVPTNVAPLRKGANK